MKKLYYFVILMLLVSISHGAVNSNDQRKLGEKIFKLKSCTMCHKKDLNSFGPSIVKIAFEYSGKEKRLYEYLQGKKSAIIQPKKAKIMKGQLLKLKALDDKKVKAITRYIITISDREF